VHSAAGHKDAGVVYQTVTGPFRTTESLFFGRSWQTLGCRSAATFVLRPGDSAELPQRSNRMRRSSQDNLGDD